MTSPTIFEVDQLKQEGMTNPDAQSSRRLFIGGSLLAGIGIGLALMTSGGEKAPTPDTVNDVTPAQIEAMRSNSKAVEVTMPDPATAPYNVVAKMNGEALANGEVGQTEFLAAQRDVLNQQQDHVDTNPYKPGQQIIAHTFGENK